MFSCRRSHNNMHCIISVFIVAIAFFVPIEACKGCVSLDEYSFKKIVPKFKHSLIKYDIAYPYGAKHDTFVKFAEELVNVDDLLVGEIGIKDYGDKDNEEFSRIQGVDTKKLPSVKLYTGKNVYTFDGDEITVDKLRDFVVSRGDIHITLPGCLEKFDLIARDFMVKKNDRTKLIKEAQSIKVDDKEDVAKIYKTYMGKIESDGENFVENEVKRLKRILENGKLAENKKKDLEHKLNILHSFRIKKIDEKKDEL